VSEAERLLALLADVHEPPAPQAALPWWWMLNALLAAAWFGLWAWRRHRRRNAWRREAIAALDTLSGRDAAARLVDMAILLRRVVRGRLGESVASLDGEAWLELLDRCFDTRWFTRGDGRLFGPALYRRGVTASVDIDAVQAGLRSQLKRLPTQRTAQLPSPAPSGLADVAGS